MIDDIIISSLFVEGGTYSPAAALDSLEAKKEDDTTYILNGCKIVIEADQSLKYEVYPIK